MTRCPALLHLTMLIAKTGFFTLMRRWEFFAAALTWVTRWQLIITTPSQGDLKIATLDKRVTYDFETPVQQTLFNALSPSSYASSTFRDLAVAEGNTAKSLDATALADIPSTILKVTFHPDSQQYCVVTAIDTPFFIRRDDAIPEDENGFRIQDEEDVELERKKREGEAEVIEILPGNMNKSSGWH